MNEIRIPCPDPAGWTPEQIDDLANMHPGIDHGEGLVPQGDNFRIARLFVPNDVDAAEIAEAVGLAALGD